MCASQTCDIHEISPRFPPFMFVLFSISPSSPRTLRSESCSRMKNCVTRNLLLKSIGFLVIPPSSPGGRGTAPQGASGGVTPLRCKFTRSGHFCHIWRFQVSQCQQYQEAETINLRQFQSIQLFHFQPESVSVILLHLQVLFSISFLRLLQKLLLLQLTVQFLFPFSIQPVSIPFSYCRETEAA